MGRLRIITGAVILAAWTGALFNGVLTQDYQAVDISTPVMLIFCGYLFGEGILRKRIPEAQDDH